MQKETFEYISISHISHKVFFFLNETNVKIKISKDKQPPPTPQKIVCCSQVLFQKKNVSINVGVFFYVTRNLQLKQILIFFFW